MFLLESDPTNLQALLKPNKVLELESLPVRHLGSSCSTWGCAWGLRWGNCILAAKAVVPAGPAWSAPSMHHPGQENPPTLRRRIWHCTWFLQTDGVTLFVMGRGCLGLFSKGR